MNKVFNRITGEQTSRVEINYSDADPLEPATLNIYDAIGVDPWDGSGVKAKDIIDAVALIEPKTRQLNVHINSPGGYCDEAMTIRSRLNDYPGKILMIVDGVAASAATWCIPADEVHCYEYSQFFVHDAIGMCFGNEADMEDCAANLGKTSDQIADIYKEKTGKSHKSMRDLMKEETLMTGKEAKDLGFVDKIIEGRPVSNFTEMQITNMKKHLRKKNSAAQAGNQNQQQNNIIMNRTQMIATLNEWGVKFENTITDEELIALIQKGRPAPSNVIPAPVPAPAPAVPAAVPAPGNPDYQTLLNRVQTLEANNLRSGRALVEGRINRLIEDDRLTEAEREDALILAADPTNGERYLNSLEKRPAAIIGSLPLRNSIITSGETSFDDLVAAATKDAQFRNQFFGAGAAKTSNMDEYERKRWLNEVGTSAMEMAQLLRRNNNKQKIIDNWQWRPKNATTTIDPGLQRQVIMMDMLEAFQPILLKLNAFSTVFDNVPREGTDTVDVPYYSLDAEASNSWNPAVGYVGTPGVVNARPIYIGGSGLTSGQNAPAGYAKDRKWLALSFSSYELRAQPYVNWNKLASQKARKLAIDVFADIIGGVMTIANYGNAVMSMPAAAFDSTAIAKLTEVANGLNWPDTDRSLILDHTYWTPLLQDPTFKQYLSAGTTETLRKQEISEAYGYENIDKIPNFFSYAPGPNNQARTQMQQEYLYGFICWKYAMLIATAPIMPAEAVRALMVRYDLGTAPATGITLEYREFGNQVNDTETRVIECSYGAAPGVQTALGRIVSQGN